MGLPEDLLKQAHHLAHKEEKRPQQASLRRAISTAYYALFHLLCKDAANRLIPGQPAALPKYAQRALAHADMKGAAKGISQPSLGKPYSTILPNGVPLDLADVARIFVGLQDARHEADYDTNKRFSRSDVLNSMEDTEDAFKKWKAVRDTPEANVFLTMMFLWKQLSSR